MRPERPQFRLLAAALSLAVGSAAASPVAASTGPALYRYAVSFDDRPIGSHTFVIDRDGGTQRVRSRAEFDVKILFVPVYRYAHTAEEVWERGCLATLAAETDDNGRRYAVRVTENANGIDIEREAPERASERHPVDCPATFAYWDPAELERDALVNSQTGALTPVSFRFEGEDQVAGEPALRYRLEPAGLDPIVLWYRASDRRWLQLETRRDSGVLRYRLAAEERATAVR
jgi:hypothetical protein